MTTRRPRRGPVGRRKTRLEADTAEMCPFGPHMLKGPPEPFCCDRRKRSVLKLQAGEHPAFRDPRVDDQDRCAACQHFHEGARCNYVVAGVDCGCAVFVRKGGS